MLTLPGIVEKDETPFVAVRRNVTLPFGDAVPGILDDLDAALGSLGASPAGPVFFKHNVVSMPDLEMDFGVPVVRPVGGAAGGVTGVLPAGRYAEQTYFGHYDDLITVNGALNGWALHAGLEFDSIRKPDGEHFACRLDIYHNSPAEEPDPSRWKTSVSIKLRNSRTAGRRSPGGKAPGLPRRESSAHTPPNLGEGTHARSGVLPCGDRKRCGRRDARSSGRL